MNSRARRGCPAPVQLDPGRQGAHGLVGQHRAVVGGLDVGTAGGVGKQSTLGQRQAVGQAQGQVGGEARGPAAGRSEQAMEGAERYYVDQLYRVDPAVAPPADPPDGPPIGMDEDGDGGD